MKTLTLTTRQCSRFATIQLHAASVIWSGFMGYQLVKYGPEIALDNREQEVRG